MAITPNDKFKKIATNIKIVFMIYIVLLYIKDMEKK